MSEFLSTADAENQHADDRRSRSAVPPIRATDGERLMRFWRHRDESAFAEVVELHAGLVWGVCSQVLRRREDVEDAFQATFLILARKAKSIRAADSAAGWLYRVAFRTALLARNRRLRRTEESLVHEPATDDDQLEAITRNEQCLVLLEELHALPMQYRQPLVLCYLEGRSRSEAADELGVTPQTVKGALARGTRMLRSRLVSRGAALSTTMAVVSASMATAQAAAPPMLISHTAALGAGFALKLAGAGATATAMKSGAATILAEKGILAMTIAAASKPAVAVLGVCLTAGMLAVATADGPKGGGGGSVTGRAPVVLLADAVSDSGEAPSGDAASANADAEFTAAADAAANEGANLNRDDEGAEGAIVAAASSDDPFAAPLAAVPGLEAQPAAAILAANPIEIAISNPTPKPKPPSEVVVKWAAAAKANVPSRPIEKFPVSTDVLAPRTAAPSEKSLTLEAEYWDIKAKALKKKADAIAAHAKAAAESGQQTSTETLAAEAEAELTLAEVKMCEINSLRIKEALQAAEAGKLKVGSKGPQVELLQQALNELLKPSPKLDADGDFGPMTQQAVIQFQKAHGLKGDGVVDATTSEALGASLGLATPTDKFDRSRSIADKQQALMRSGVLHAEAHAKQAAKAAIAAAAQSAQQAERAATEKVRAGRGRYGEGGRGFEYSPSELNPKEMAAMDKQLKELQKANEKLQNQLEELTESRKDSRD